MKTELIPVALSLTTDYLFRAGEKYVLVDTGYEKDRARFYSGLKKAGVDLGDIGHVILTHHHDDHCGLLCDLIGRNPSIRAVSSRRCAELLSKGENDKSRGGYLNRRVALLSELYFAFDPGGRAHRFPPYTLRENDIALDGDTELCDIGIQADGKIIFTPGHTEDSVSIVFQGGDCLAGDAAANMLKLTGAKHHAPFMTDQNECYKSWEKLIKAGAKRIYPAHGRPFPAERLINTGRNRKGL